MKHPVYLKVQVSLCLRFFYNLYIFLCTITLLFVARGRDFLKYWPDIYRRIPSDRLFELKVISIILLPPRKVLKILHRQLRPNRAFFKTANVGPNSHSIVSKLITGLTEPLLLQIISDMLYKNVRHNPKSYHVRCLSDR